jgi:hypothetical protein
MLSASAHRHDFIHAMSGEQLQAMLAAGALPCETTGRKMFRPYGSVTPTIPIANPPNANHPSADHLRRESPPTQNTPGEALPGRGWFFRVLLGSPD